MGKIVRTIIVLSFLSCSCTWASPNLDSLHQVLQQSEMDTNRIHTLVRLAYAYKRDSTSLSQHYAQEAVELATKLSEKSLLIKSKMCQWSIYDFLADNPTSERIAKEALTLANEIQSNQWIAKIHNDLGVTYWSQYRMTEAAEHLHISLKYYETLNDTQNILQCYHYIGWVYHQLLIFDKTLEYYDKGIELAKSVHDTEQLLGFLYDKAWVFYQEEKYPKSIHEFLQLRALAQAAKIPEEDLRAVSMLGEIYMTLEQNDSALYYYRLTEQLAKELDDPFELETSYQGIGGLLAKSNPDSAIYYYNQSLVIAKAAGDPTNLAYTQFELGEFWREQKNYAKSIQYLNMAKEFFQASSDDKRVSDVLMSLSNSYYEQGNGNLAYKTLLQARELQDSLYTEQNNEIRQQTEARYQLRKKEEQIDLLNEKNSLKLQKLKQQKLLLISIGAILVLMVGLAIASYRAYRQKQLANRLLADQNEEIRQQHAATEQAKKYIEQHAERLKELDSLKTRFFANVSHELRTPLTLILGPLKHLLQRKGLEQQLHKDLGLMERNGKKLLGLVEEILDISKLDAEKLQLHEVSTHLSSFIRRIFANFESQAQYLGIHYQLIEQIPEGCHALIDQNRVEKILNNLLANAIKFTPKDESVLLSAQIVGQHIDIVVKDTGEGISPEDLPHVFERFFQTKHSHTKAAGGTGIGLALSKELAELMGGSLNASSTLSKGSSFSLSIPFKESVEPSTILADETSYAEYDIVTSAVSSMEKTYRLLIVEDNPDMQQYIISLIKDDYDYLLAQDGQEALDLLEKEEQQVDLILSDVMMPRMDGFELLSHIKASPKLSSLPFIILTARAAEEDKLNALTIGVNDYLIKPFFQNELMVRLQNLLTNYQARKEWAELAEPEEELSIELAPENIAAVPNPDQEWINLVEQEIRQSVHKVDYSINSLAEHMNISTRQFQRKLKKLTGMTPVKYQQEIRLQIAREHLELGKATSVKELAYTIGFQKVSYFSKLFLERFGKRPSDFLN